MSDTQRTCARCHRRGDEVRTFYDRDVVRRRCPDCRQADPVEMCPWCAQDLLVHDLCPVTWGQVIR